MFKGKKYVTQGIEATIPKALQVYLWELVCQINVEQIDYLQVFHISSVEKGLKIIHTQEEPGYKAEYFYETDGEFAIKVYCIDDGAVCTMMLSEEY